ARENGGAFQAAAADGFKPQPIASIATNCDVLAILLPDDQIPPVYAEAIEPYLSSSKTFIFAHGFSVHHKTVRLPEISDVVLVAPTGPGRQLRSLYQEGNGLPALIAVEQDESGSAMKKGLAYAMAIGCTRAGVIETTFAEETVVDLFCEQAVLCGGLPELIKRSFSTLVDNGYQPELAYISCLKEVKLIADLLFSAGLDGMREAISTTAQYGSVVTGPKLIDSGTADKLTKVLRHIESGSFGKDFLNERKSGSAVTLNFIKAEKHSRLVATGRQLRDCLRF
ncbi:MAG TPA: ketol-acid reductoisomerase, partial [Chroococcales cyanobacterium]